MNNINKYLDSLFLYKPCKEKQKRYLEQFNGDIKMFNKTTKHNKKLHIPYLKVFGFSKEKFIEAYEKDVEEIKKENENFLPNIGSYKLIPNSRLGSFSSAMLFYARAKKYSFNFETPLNIATAIKEAITNLKECEIENYNIQFRVAQSDFYYFTDTKGKILKSFTSKPIPKVDFINEYIVFSSI